MRRLLVLSDHRKFSFQSEANSLRLAVLFVQLFSARNFLWASSSAEPARPFCGHFFRAANFFRLLRDQSFVVARGAIHAQLQINMPYIFSRVFRELPAFFSLPLSTAGFVARLPTQLGSFASAVGFGDGLFARGFFCPDLRPSFLYQIARLIVSISSINLNSNILSASRYPHLCRFASSFHLQPELRRGQTLVGM